MQKRAMHAELRSETLRLIELQQDLFDRIHKLAGKAASRSQSDDAAAQPVAGWTTEAIERKLGVLAERKLKVDKLETVLAVVGTMKAGKSTTINAIVGREVLPHRNRPMTALPTKIRHVKGQTTPVLVFEKIQPIAKLIKSLAQKLKQAKASETQVIENDNHLSGLAQLISEGRCPLAKRYEGEEAIYTFLAFLNDLVRLSRTFHARDPRFDFPFSDYQSIEDFPCIDVEFFHLAEHASNESLGQLILLDTPGFNEDGQSDVLLHMMQTQIEKADAVLAVLDYTQLKSESEAKLRAELQKIAEFAGNRLFALVNKFDQSNAGSDNADQTRRYVSQGLLKKMIAEERVYPVSTQAAFLAQRARLMVERDGGLQLREDGSDAWIDDFGQKAFGQRYKKFIQDNEAVQEAAADIWSGSRFDTALRGVVHHAYERSVPMVIESATQDMQEFARGARKYVALRKTSLGVKVGELEKLLAELNKRIGKLSNIKARAKEDVQAQVLNVTTLVNSEFETTRKKLESAVSEFIEKGRIDTRRLFEEELRQALHKFHFYRENYYPKRELDRLVGSMLDRLPSRLEDCNRLLRNLQMKRPSLDRDEVLAFFPEPGSSPGAHEDQKLELDAVYESKDKADAAVKAATLEIDNIMRSMSEALESQLQHVSGETERGMGKAQKEIAAQIRSFEGDAQAAGFENLAIEVPAIEELQMGMKKAGGTDDLIDHQQAPRKRRVEQAGVFGWIKRKVDFFDAEWGVDSYSVNEDRYTVNTGKFKKRLSGRCEKEMDRLQHLVSSSFVAPLQDNTNAYFKKLDNVFETIRDGLQNGLNDRQRSITEQRQLTAALDELATDLDNSLPDIGGLLADASRLMEALAPQAEPARATASRPKKRERAEA